MTDPKKLGRPKGSTKKGSMLGKAKHQQKHHRVPPSVQVQGTLANFDDKAATPRRAAVAASAALNTAASSSFKSTTTPASQQDGANGGASTITDAGLSTGTISKKAKTKGGKRLAVKSKAATLVSKKRKGARIAPSSNALARDAEAPSESAGAGNNGGGKGAKRGRHRSVLKSPEISRGVGGSKNGSKRRKTSISRGGSNPREDENDRDDHEEEEDEGEDEEIEDTAGSAKKSATPPAHKRKHLLQGRPGKRRSGVTATAATPTAAAVAKKKSRGRGRSPSAPVATGDLGEADNGNGDVGTEDGGEDDTQVAAAATQKSRKKKSSHKRDGSRAQSRRGSTVNTPTKSTPDSARGRGRAVDTGGPSSSYPKRKRNAPDVFKAGPSVKKKSPSKVATPVSSGSRKLSDTSSSSGKPASLKKGAAAAARAVKEKKAAVATPSATKGKSKSKSGLKKKKTMKPVKPARALPPPPPPPPYRFECEGWPAVGGRELLSAGMFLCLAAPIMKFGRGFEVKMQALEEAVSSEEPQENELLSLVHSRLLCTRRELKTLKPGEMKYPYSWWTERLRGRLADWYRRRAVLRELIYEAERSDEDEDEDEEVPSAGGVEKEQQAASGERGGVTAGRKKKKRGANGKGSVGTPAARRDETAPQIGLPNGGNADTIDARESAAVGRGGAVAGGEVDDSAPAGQKREKRSRQLGGGVEEMKGGEGPVCEGDPASAAVTQVQGVQTREGASISKRVSATQCMVCNTRGTVMDMVRCIYEGCGNKYHLRCLIPVLDKVPKGQWYCPDCRSKKRVFGCNACMQNDRPSKILQCDGPMCGLEYHLGCLDPPLSKVPTSKWWYCPDCVRTDNRVGCRVCKNDVDYQRLLKCDGPGCELEWHMYCLQPPLKVVPKGDFFCPYCKAKQKVEFEKKRRQEIARANERRRRREAKKARAAADDSDEDGEPAYGGHGVAGLRPALLDEYEDLEPDSLRLELHRITILLRNIEDAKEVSAAAAAAAATDTAETPTTPAEAAEPDAAADKSEDEKENTRSPGAKGSCGVAGTSNGVPSSSKGVDSGTSQGKAGGGVTVEGGGAGEGGSAVVALTESEDNKAAVDGAGGAATSSTGRGNGSEGGSGANQAADPVVAFWAALAAAAPAESVPTDSSGDGEDGREDEEEEEVDGAWGGAGDSPLAKDKTYESLSVALRVGILSALCEEYMDDEDFRLRIIDDTAPELLRNSPLGHDSSGRLYYRFVHFRKEMRVYRTVERDSPIPPVDKVATEMTGSGILEAAAEKAAERKAPRLRGGSEVELVTDSLEGMERLVEALGKSKSKSKLDDAVLHASLAEEVEEMKTWVNERMEKEEKKRLADEAREKRQLALEAQPRRRSGRLIRAETGWAEAKPEEDKKDQMDEEEEEEEEVPDDTNGTETQMSPSETSGAGAGAGAGGDDSVVDGVPVPLPVNGGSSTSPLEDEAEGEGEGRDDEAVERDEEEVEEEEGVYDSSSIKGDGTVASREEEPAQEGAPKDASGARWRDSSAVDSGTHEGLGQEGKSMGSVEEGVRSRAAEDRSTTAAAVVIDPDFDFDVGEKTHEATLEKKDKGKDPPTGDEVPVVDVPAVTTGGASAGGVGNEDAGGENTGDPQDVGVEDGGDDGKPAVGDPSKRQEIGKGLGPGVAAAEKSVSSPPSAFSDASEAAAATVAAAAAPNGDTDQPGAAVTSAPAAPPATVFANGGDGESAPPNASQEGGGASRPGETDDQSGERSASAAVSAAPAAAAPSVSSASSVIESDAKGLVVPHEKKDLGEPGRAPADRDGEEKVGVSGVVPSQQEQSKGLPSPSNEKNRRGGAADGEDGGKSATHQRSVDGGCTIPSPARSTSPQHGKASNGALDIMAIAACSRPKVTTPTSSRSPSRDRSGSLSSPGSGSNHNGHKRPVQSPRAASGALDIMAAAVEGRAPAPLITVGSGSSAGGSAGIGGSGKGSSTVGSPKNVKGQ